MGLDNIVYETRAVNDKDLAETLAPLTTGIMVDGTNSFRGKVYDRWFQAITDYTLFDSDDFDTRDYESIIKHLKDYKESFSKMSELESDLESNYMSLDELDAFIKLFQLCLERGWKINAWY